MAQLNLYVPDEVAVRLRGLAESQGKSLSGFVVDLIQHSIEAREFDWKAHFERLAQLSPSDIEYTDKDRYFGKLRDISLD